MLRKGHGCLYKAPTMEERRKRMLRGEREIRSSLLILYLKDGRLDSGKQEDGKTFHKLHVLGVNDYLRDRLLEVGSETWKGGE